MKASPTLLQYLSPVYFACGLAATNENPEPYVRDANDHGWGSRSICVDDAFLADLDRWIQSYHPANVGICYGQPEHVLIRPLKSGSWWQGQSHRLLFQAIQHLIWP